MAKTKAIISLPIPKERKGGTVEKIDVQKAIELRLKGVSYQDIANHFNCSKTAVILRLKPYVPAADINVELYKKNRADLYAYTGATVLAALTGDNLKKVVDKSPMAAVTLFNSLFNNERLERGQSTQNVAQFWASAVIDADKEARTVTETVTELQPNELNPSNDK